MRKIKEDDCGIARIKAGDQEAWSQGNNQKRWMLTENGYTWATVTIKTSREKREDWTGKRDYKVITRNRFFVELRVGYGVNLKLEDFFVNKSVKKQIEYFLTHKEALLDMALWHVRMTCRKVGVPEHRIYDIVYPQYETSTELKIAKLLDLVEQA